MQHTFSFTTRRVAEIAGVERSAILTAFQRHGHWRGIVPRRQPNGRLLWPAQAVLQACGKLPQSARPTPTDALRDRVCAQASVDLFQGHQFAAHILSESAHGATPREQIQNLAADLRDFAELAGALARRVGDTMQNEEAMQTDDWRLYEYHADQISHAVEHVCAPLRWHSHKAPAAPSNAVTTA